MRKQAWLIAMGGTILVASGCELPHLSAENSLPPLVSLRGTVTLPPDFAPLDPAASYPEGYTVTLATLNGAVLATGPVLNAKGQYSLQVPLPSLGDRPTLQQIELTRGPHAVILRAIATLGPGSAGPVNLDTTTTTVALAALRYRASGGDPSRWDPAGLAGQPKILELAGVYSAALSRWSNQSAGNSAGATPPDPGPSTLDAVIAVARGR